MKKTTIEKMFLEAFNIKAEEMKIGEIINVSNYGIEILSYNENKKINEYRLIKNIIRKRTSIGYSIVVSGSEMIFSKNHLLFVLFDGMKSPSYIEVGNLKKFKGGFKLLNEQNIWVDLDSPIQKKENVSIFDFEVEGNHNYFSNGVLSHNTIFGNPETTTGGNALKFYASIRLDIRRISTEKDGDISTGNRVKVKVVKNKTYPPFKTCEFSIVFGEGISLEGEIVDIGSEMGIIKKAGSWYSFEETKLGQGRDSVIAILKDNVELREVLREKILQNI
jgi:hypothetical protein